MVLHQLLEVVSQFFWSIEFAKLVRSYNGRRRKNFSDFAVTHAIDLMNKFMRPINSK